MKRLVLGLAAVALAFGVASVEAHDQRYSTTVVIDDFLNTDGNPESDTVIGTLTTNRRCRGGRRVKFYLENGGDPEAGYTLFDTDKTNKDGEWRGGTDNTIGNGGKARVTRENVGEGDHDHICKADTALWD